MLSSRRPLPLPFRPETRECPPLAGGGGSAHLLDQAASAAAGGYADAPSRRLAPGGDKMRHTWNRVEALGMSHLAQTPQAEWSSEPSDAEVRLVRALSSSVDRRARQAADPGKLATGMTYLELFSVALPSRPLWRKRSHGEADRAAVAHNAKTWELLREFIRAHGSIRPGHLGETLPAATIAEYIGALQMAFAVDLHGALTDDTSAARTKRICKGMRVEDGPVKTDRVIRRLGFRAQHFRRAAATPAVDRTSEKGRFNWMLSLMMYYCMMRAGEPGRGKGSKPFNVQRGVRLCDVEWWSGALTGTGLRAVVLMLVSSKPAAGGVYTRRPCEISERSTAPGASDPLCGYAAFLAYWRQRSRSVCARAAPCTAAPFCAACQAAPLFVSPDGVVPTTASCMVIARDMCEAIGENPQDYTGYSWRIGMASDLVAKLGHERAETVTKRRGRWRGDIFHIYQRSDVGEQLDASASIMDTEGHSLESLLPQWVQPRRGWP